MKKAQWKQDPRERAFGKDPRDVLNQKLTEHVQDLEEKVAYLNQRYAAQKENWDHQRANFLERIKSMQPKAQAYAFLRQEGVVLASNEEFKHLKGEDMDAFFGIESPPKVPQNQWERAMMAVNTPPPKIVATPGLQQQVEKLLNAEFERAFNEYMLTGKSATHVTFDEEFQATWQPLQK